jgi:hypothetical protein
MENLMETRASGLARLAKQASELRDRMAASVERQQQTVRTIELQLETVRDSLQDAEIMLAQMEKTSQIANEAAQAAALDPSRVN